MRSLFVRIIISYWLATGLVVATAVATTSWVAWQRLRAFDQLDPVTLSDGASAALAQNGRPGLLAWAQSVNSSIASPNIYVVDTNGKDLLGRTVTSTLILRGEMAVETLRAGKSWTRWPRYAAVISDPTAGSYLLMVTASSSAPSSALGDLRVLSILVLSAFGMVGLVCWAVARTISTPVESLQSSVRALANGDLNARVSPAVTMRRDELGALARDFDLMAERLRGMLASKETLMRDLSHELRSPLARMRVALGLARANGSTIETQFARVEREAERMDGLVGQLLRLSRLMNSELRPVLAPTDLSELVTETVDDARLEASGTGKVIEWHYPGPVTVLADAEMMRHAIENVLRNALRFTPEGGIITLMLSSAGGVASLLVQDQGPGIPEHEIPRIFQPFYRAQNSEGTGVGLAITERVMVLNSGTVAARNIPGSGLEVEFRLGLAPLPPFTRSLVAPPREPSP
jgi:two-component system sensor histidine kinase CpxA